MSWRDDLRRVKFADGRNLIGATFRGVPFFVESSERGGGRRTVLHKFPLRDDPYSEDMGRDERTFTVDGYVLGDDYLTQRDALISALEDVEGPGELVHPYYGTRIVACPKFNVREARDVGGIANISINFEETPTQAPTPSLDVDSAGDVSDSADAADDATDAEFAEQFDSEGLPGFALASAETAITNAAAAMRDTLGPVIADTQEAAQLTGQVALITAEAASLVRTPALILGKFHDTLAALGNTITAAPGALMNAFLAAYSIPLGDPVDPTTSTRARELTNQTALQNALKRVFAIEAARLAPKVPFASTEEATAARDQLTEILDEQAAAADDTAYPALVDLRSKVMRAVPGTSKFASVVRVTRRAPIPSLLLAYQLYGSVDLELDIVSRNDIRHPGFVTGTLKVLSNG